jgi:hypothetical protein
MMERLWSRTQLRQYRKKDVPRARLEAETMAAIEDIAAGRLASDAALAVTAVATLGKRAATSLHVA